MNRLIWILPLSVLLLAPLGAQGADLLQRGQQQYAQLDFTGARRTFSQILETPTLVSFHPNALLWWIRTEMALKAWDQASALVERFLQNYPSHPLAREALYEKGRILYSTGDLENALLTFDAFLKTDPDRELTSNALFWMGECAYGLGRWEEAQVLYRRVVEAFPTSFKVEASRYRMSMIEMKLREEELLRLLRWSHEELVNSLDEFRRRERAYQQAIQAYQRRILEFERSDLASRVRQLEQQLQEASRNRLRINPQQPTTTPTAPPAEPAAPQASLSTLRELQEIKAQAEELKRFYDEWEALNARGR